MVEWMTRGWGWEERHGQVMLEGGGGGHVGLAGGGVGGGRSGWTMVGGGGVGGTVGRWWMGRCRMGCGGWRNG